MGKKKNKMKNVEENETYEFENHESDSTVPFPEKLNQDDLSLMDDDDLHMLGRSLNDSIGRVNRYSLNPYLWEVEMCYVQREMHVRSVRRAAHAAWMSNNPSLESN